MSFSANGHVCCVLLGFGCSWVHRHLWSFFSFFSYLGVADFRAFGAFVAHSNYCFFFFLFATVFEIVCPVHFFQKSQSTFHFVSIYYPK